MKTAMQELIEELEVLENNTISMSDKFLIKSIRFKTIAKIEKEKEQIIEFGYKCRNKCKKESKLLPQDIFNTTYNQNK